MADFNEKIYETLSLTEKRLYVQYGHALELDAAQLADVLGFKNSRVVFWQRTQGVFPIPCYKKGRKLYASLAHVARYLDARDRGAVEELCETQRRIYGRRRADELKDLYSSDS